MAQVVSGSSFGPICCCRGPGRRMHCAISGKCDCIERQVVDCQSSLSEGQRFTVVRRWAVGC